MVDLPSYKLVDVFVAKVDTSFNVLDFFKAEDVEKIPSDKKGGFELSIEPSLKESSEFENMLLCEFRVDGGSVDKTMRMSCIVTGVFYVDDLANVLADEGRQEILSALTNKDVFPYVRSLILDLGRYLPIDTLIRIPANFGSEEKSKNKKKKKQKSVDQKSQKNKSPGPND